MPTATTASGPKFKVGDKVTYKGEPGTITELAVHAKNWFTDGNEQLYSVKCEPWKKVEKDGKQWYENKAGDKRDHECDTFGCVPESQISK